MSKQAKLTNNLKRNLIHTLQKPEKAPVSSTIPEGVFYMPGVGNYAGNWEGPDAGFGYAVACLEIVLLFNPRAKEPYKRLVNVCRGTEIQSLWKEYTSNAARNTKTLQKHNRRYHNIIASLVQGEPMSENTREKTIRMALNYGGNPKELPPGLIESLSTFILEAFNRNEDIRNRCHKVTFDVRKNLCWAVLFKALSESLDIDIGKQDRTNPTKLLYLFGEKPKNRADRKRKTKLIEKLHSLGLGSTSREALLFGARLWYRVRVDPGKEADVLDELEWAHTSTLSKLIQPYDEAMGYPRRGKNILI